MNLSSEQLDLIEKMGANFFSIKETAIVLQMKYHQLKQLLEDERSEAYQRYYKGKFLSQMELRESIFALAKRGSNPAQKMALDILTGMNTSNI
jgi:hypothetical protein